MYRLTHKGLNLNAQHFIITQWNLAVIQQKLQSAVANVPVRFWGRHFSGQCPLRASMGWPTSLHPTNRPFYLGVGYG